MVGNGKTNGRRDTKISIPNHQGVEVTIDRVTIAESHGKPLVRMSLYAKTDVKILGKTKEVTELLRLNETPGRSYLDPDIVNAFWNEVQRAIVDNIDKAR